MAENELNFAEVRLRHGSGWIPSSRCFGVTDFACTWLAQTKLSEESGKPEESEVWRRRESNLTRFSETGLFTHVRRESRPRNTRVPLNTRSIAPSQAQHNEGTAGRRLSVL